MMLANMILLAAANCPVIPLPREVEELEGTCSTTSELKCVHRECIPKEGYELDISPGAITAYASTEAGFFYAKQTLAQLAFGRTEMPCMKIVDAPRFRWRGMMWDASRCFPPVEEVKRMIDLISRYKMNVFHWHLTDNHGWRIEMPKYPKLQTVAAWRYQFDYPTKGEVGRYGGCYTVAQMKDVVAYAAERHVTVVPEIDVPGHACALLCAYPELACDGVEDFGMRSLYEYPPRNYKRWQSVHPVVAATGGGRAEICPGKEAAFAFLDDVFEELTEIFPSEYVHIGGDEAGWRHWETCASCRNRMAAEGMKSARELMPYVAQRVGKMLAKRGRKALGWDDVLEGGMPEGMAVQSWRGDKGGIKAAMRGVKVVMSPMRYCYIDEGQTIYYDEPDVWPGFVPIELVYCYDPVPEEVLAAGKADLVMGFEACLWTFYAYNQRIRDTQCWPRTCAVAEVAWSDPDRKNLVDFRRRVNATKRYLDSLGVDYYDKKKDYSDYDLSEKDDIPTFEKVKERSRQLKALRTGKKTSR